LYSCPHQESNPDQKDRSLSFYPLNYRGRGNCTRNLGFTELVQNKTRPLINIKCKGALFVSISYQIDAKSVKTTGCGRGLIAVWEGTGFGLVADTGVCSTCCPMTTSSCWRHVVRSLFLKYACFDRPSNEL
jgi:hypothetical protein